MKILSDLGGGSVLNTKRIFKSVFNTVHPALYRQREKSDSTRSSITILI